MKIDLTHDEILFILYRNEDDVPKGWDVDKWCKTAREVDRKMLEALK